MGGGSPPSVNETTQQMLQALAQYAPAAIKAIDQTAPGTAQSQLDVQRQVAPGYADLQNQIYADYGPEANRIGSEINRANQLAATQTESDLIAGPGKGLVSQADELQRSLDPEYYSNRAAISKSLNDYLGKYDPFQLNDSELENINRGISGRTGPMTQSNLNTVRNAQTFGAAGTERWKNFGNAILQASSTLPGMRSGISGFEVATRRPLYTNSGEGRLSSPQANNALSAFNQNFGFANNTLNNIGQTTAASIQKKQSGADIFGKIAGGLGSLFGG